MKMGSTEAHHTFCNLPLHFYTNLLHLGVLLQPFSLQLDIVFDNLDLVLHFHSRKWSPLLYESKITCLTAFSRRTAVQICCLPALW